MGLVRVREFEVMVRVGQNIKENSSTFINALHNFSIYEKFIQD